VIAHELALRLLVTTDTGGDHLQEAFARMAGIYELAAIARIEMQPRKLLLFALRLPRLDLYSCTRSIEMLFACASDLAVQRRGAIRAAPNRNGRFNLRWRLSGFCSGDCLRCPTAVRGVKKMGCIASRRCCSCVCGAE
jgi:hypothetical protein